FEHNAKFPDFMSMEEQMPANSNMQISPKSREKISKSPALDYFTIDLTEKAMEGRSEEHTSELQSRENLVCRLLLEKKKTKFLLPGPGAEPRPPEERPRQSGRAVPARA